VGNKTQAAGDKGEASLSDCLRLFQTITGSLSTATVGAGNPPIDCAGCRPGVQFDSGPTKDSVPRLNLRRTSFARVRC